MTESNPPSIVDASASPSNLLPLQSDLLDRARDLWLAGDWRSLARMDLASLGNHTDRAHLAIVAAAGALQSGDRRLAREHARQAQQWGCARAVMADVLMGSARQSLGVASLVDKREAAAMRHFERAILDRRNTSETLRVAHARAADVRAALQRQREHVGKTRRAGVKAQPGGSRWLVELVAHCLAAPDLHDAVDWTLNEVLVANHDKARFLIELAEHFQASKDTMSATHFLVTAKELAASTDDQGLQAELAKRLVAAGQAVVAMDLFIEATLSGVRSAPGAAATADAVALAYKKVRDHEQQRLQHGHDLLIAHLATRLPELRGVTGTRRMILVEIGTTRENVPGQGSTRKLAEFCRQHGFHFITVDMDPHNSRVAERMFRGMGVPFEAVTMKGEDYLRDRTEVVDFVFLDAYDFDHGMHSELRQARYTKFLGSRIDEQACHQMHLDCAQSVVRLLSPSGVVCVDDTWLDEGAWTAKGTLAMPYLLEHGYTLIEARNRAALLSPPQKDAGGGE